MTKRSVRRYPSPSRGRNEHDRHPPKKRHLAQLGHSAATTHATEPGAPVWAPSAVTGELMRRGQRAHAMSVGEIAEIVAAFGAAAERCRKGGMDGVEILAAFGFLVAAFLSPVANRRTDAYGGSLDNRMRFCREVVSAVRDAVGRGRIVGLRVPGDELIEGGLQLEEMKDVARALESDGKLDYLNVIAGTNMDRLLRAEHWPPTPARHGLFVHLAAGIRSVVELPVFTVGRITDPVPASPSLVWDRAGGGAAVTAAEHLAVDRRPRGGWVRCEKPSTRSHRPWSGSDGARPGTPARKRVTISSPRSLP